MTSGVFLMLGKTMKTWYSSSANVYSLNSAANKQNLFNAKK